jgi:hypothetical protein
VTAAPTTTVTAAKSAVTTTTAVTAATTTTTVGKCSCAAACQRQCQGAHAGEFENNTPYAFHLDTPFVASRRPAAIEFASPYPTGD